MGAINRGHKQYVVRYEMDRMICGSYDHPAGNASSVRGAKAVIRNTRKAMANHNPRNFRVYDCWADVDETTNHVPCVYQED